MNKGLLLLAGEFLPGLNFILLGRFRSVLALWAFIYASVLLLWILLCALGGSRIVCWAYIAAVLSVTTLCNIYRPKDGPTPNLHENRVKKLMAMGGIIASLILLQNSHLGMQFRIKAGSMEPTLKIGDVVIADPFSYRLPGRKIMHGDLAVHRTPGRGKTLFIHRVLGVPGDEVEISKGQLYLNGVLHEKSRLPVNEAWIRFRSMELQKYLMHCGDGRMGEDHCSVLEMEYQWLTGSVSWKVAEGQYFLLGDDVFNSYDSKIFGPLDRKDIESRIICYGFGPDLDSESLGKIGEKIR